MLVLSRKPGQSLHIGEDIRVVVVRLEKGRVRIGIEAPRHVRIQRDEAAEILSSPSRCGKPLAAFCRLP